MSDINELSFLKQLNGEKTNFIAICPELKVSIDKLMVYCVTNDDNVYVLCFDEGKYISDVNQNFTPEPQKVKELCQKRVINIKCGINFILALTKCGRIYSCGLNYRAQLGHGNTINVYIRPTIIRSLNDKCIVDISCGGHHSLALTRNGEVYEWGYIQSPTIEYITVPTQVIGLQYQTIIAIASGLCHSMVLTENGDVFSWGKNNRGQLGIGNDTYQRNPIKIENLNGDKIVKISCGDSHNMLLTENGDIYMFGDNSRCQMGLKSNRNNFIPIKLIIETKFVDIVAQGFYFYQLSISLSVDGFCYVWGQCDERKINKPTKTVFKSIEDLLMNYSKFQMTYKPYYFKKTFENMLPYERIEVNFNNREYRLNDLTFKIDDKYIYAQKQYLISVCEHFDILFSHEWIESTNNEIEITQYSYSVYYALLKYLYTHSVDINSKDLIELYYLSDSYFEENLKKKCIQIMKEVININNVINYYAFTVKNNFEELEIYMFDYMKNCMKDVIKTQSFETCDDSITKRLFNQYLGIRL